MNNSPTLEDQLALAERDLVCAQHIDSTARMEIEVAECRSRIAAIKALIAERDETHLENAVAALGDRHAA